MSSVGATRPMRPMNYYDPEMSTHNLHNHNNTDTDNHEDCDIQTEGLYSTHSNLPCQSKNLKTVLPATAVGACLMMILGALTTSQVTFPSLFKKNDKNP